jgi:hypothetical protein
LAKIISTFLLGKNCQNFHWAQNGLPNQMLPRQFVCHVTSADMVDIAMLALLMWQTLPCQTPCQSVMVMDHHRIGKSMMILKKHHLIQSMTQDT